MTDGAIQRPGAGTLYVVGTPIGNLEDVTLRALRVLKEVRLVAAEDTRHSRKLLAAHGIATPLVSLHEHNEAARAAFLVGKLAAGWDVAYVSDAGTPAISDPGARLVRAALAAGLRVVPVPGASAVVSALSVGGLDADAFLFAGFPPPRAAARRRALEALRKEARTLVFYESPRRLAATLREMAAILGEREAAVCREMTKVYEEVVRGTLGALAARVAAGGTPRGEITLVVAGEKNREVALFCAPGTDGESPGDAGDARDASDRGRPSETNRDTDVLTPGRLKEMAARLEKEGLSRRDRVAAIVRETGLPRRVVYQQIGKKQEGGDPGNIK